MPKRPQLKELCEDRDDIDLQQQSPSNDLDGETGSNRREFLKVIGATGAAIFLPACKKSNEKGKEPEVKEVNEVTLGNVRFYIKSPESVSKEKKAELFTTLKQAYEKLKGYLGEEVMTYSELISVPVELNLDGNSDPKAAIGRVQLSNEKGSLDGSGNIVLNKRQKPILLSLNPIAEHNIAHEFVHLYAQGTAFWSEGFWEGHAHAIEKTLYPQSDNDDTFDKLFENKGLSKLFDYGLDFSQYDRTLKGGIQSPLLYRMALVKWDLAWREFIKTEPDFFKKFYSEVTRQKNEGKTSFNKADLIRIGEMVSSKFAVWLSKTECLKDIGESEPKKVFTASIIKDQQIMFALGFKAHPKNLSGGKYTPAFLSPLAIGRLQVKGQAGKFIIKNWDNFAALAKIPKEFVNDPTIQIRLVK